MSAAQQTASAGYTRSLSEYCVALNVDRLDPGVVRVTRQTLLDTLGVMFAAASEDATCAVVAEREEEGGTPQAWVVGRGRLLPATSAALVNGTAGHALDYDDVSIEMHGHPSTVLWPAILAAADALGSVRFGGLIEAYVAGYVAAADLGNVMGDQLYHQGFHPTAVIGAIGAAAAVAKLYGMNGTDTAHALSLAATQAAGLKSMFGSTTKPVHAGLAAAAGLRAVRLIHHGLRAREDGLECKFGFASAYGTSLPGQISLDESVIVRNLFKYHASCYFTHAPLELIREFIAHHSPTPDDITAIEVQVHSFAVEACRIKHPTSALEAKFSIPHCIALALLGYDTGAIDTFGERLNDEHAMRLRQLVTLDQATGSEPTQAFMRVTMRNGLTFESRFDSGVPLADLDRQQAKIDAKFLALMTPVAGAENALTIHKSLMNLSADAPWSSQLLHV